MSNGLTPNNPTSYLGVRPTTPPQMIVMKRAPTANDVIGYVLGTQWLQYDPDQPAQAIQYVLSSVEQRVATWVPLNQGGDRPTLPDHSVVLGTGVPGFNSTSPNATIGQALVSTGASSDPEFGTVTVSGGGTGLVDCDPYSVYCGGTTGEGPLQQVAGLGSAGQVLTSQGNGMLPTWSSAGAGGAGGPIAVQIFTTGAGTYTPTAGTGSVMVEVLGGGAGGETATGGIIGGAGGGAGGYSRKLYLATDIGASQPYSVGAGGASDTVGSNTTFGAMATLITGNGGAAAAGVTTPGLGGVASGGDLNVQGGSGGIGIQTGTVANGHFAGFGGGSIYGNGAVARGNSSGVGNAGTVYGSGGGGGVDLTAAGSQAGGVGASGIVICTEYGPYGVLPPIAATTINIIVYDTPGAGVYTPTANMNQCIVECQGGGSGASNNMSIAGSSGGYCKKLFDAATIGASKAFVVGVGGAGAPQANLPNVQYGMPGGNTTFGTGPGFLVAGGGTSYTSGFTQPTGGVSTGGSININGQAAPSPALAGDTQGNTFMIPSGASSFLGIGGTPPYSLGFTPIAGRNGSGYGAGGGGGWSGGGQIILPAGGNGSSGVIIVTEYIS